MTSIDLRVGDRITALAGRALSGHTYQPLTRSVAIEIGSVRPEVGADLDVTGFVLTTRGAWRAGVPTRTVVLPAGSYTVPVRVGDTIRFPPTGETPVVTAIHLRPDGTAFADLLFTSGATTSGHLLAGLEHLARPATAPSVRPCKRRHDPDLPCRRCAEATEPVITGCEGPLCRQTAEYILVFRPPSSVAQVRALCSMHRDAFVARNPGAAIQVFPLAEGTHNYVVHGDGTQIATCRHCGHAIYLYPALRGRREPWRGHEYDETGRCGPAEDRHDILMVHEPAVTVAERDYARAAAACGPTTGDPHPLTGCPVHRP